MKTIVAASLAFLLLAGSAIAQTPPTTPPTTPETQPGLGKATGNEPRPGGPAKSARFRLQVGRIYLGLTCPDDESLKACADFAMQLLDKADALQKH